MAHNRAASLKEFAVHLVRRQIRYEQFYALKQIDLKVPAHEFLGVVGANGAGKSTLMKIIARVLPPTEGRIAVRGTVAPMIELAAGLDNELTTAENVVLYGSLLGRSPREMRQRVDRILEWAELEDYADVPVRSFSSGMLARLGFAVATDVDPDILVVDEVLAVGDQAFQHRSTERIQELMRQGTTVIFVSHDLSTIRSLASSTLWLDRGEIRMCGPTEDVVTQYEQSASL